MNEENEWDHKFGFIKGKGTIDAIFIIIIIIINRFV